MKRRILNVILVLMIIVFLVSASMVAYHYISRSGYEKDFKKLSADAPEASQVIRDPAPAIDYYEELYLQNSDTWCFITIPDTQINYPVMRTPDSPEYYLRRDFYKNYSYYGVPFAETRGVEEQFKIIYGHHINGKKMFGELINYNDRDYMASHKKVYLYTEKGVEEYTVFASVRTTGDDPNKLFSRPINGIYTQKEFSKYILDVYEKSAVSDWDSLPEYGDDILMLGTCEYSRDDGRYIVYAVKK